MERSIDMGETTTTFSNEEMLSWMGFYAKELNVSPEKIKMLDICGKKKNVLPSIETHKRVLIFANEDYAQIYYEFWEAGFGDYDIWYSEGTTPTEVKKAKVKDLMKKKLTGPTAILIVNESTRESYRVGIKNEFFSKGPIHYVGHEIRAVIMSLLEVDSHDTICIVSGESIVIESAIIASEGTIIAVEDNLGAKESMQENIDKFGVQNVTIIDSLSADTLKGLPTPRLAFLVASKHLESDIQSLLQKNPKMQFVIYTLELDMLCDVKKYFKRYGITNTEVMQISVSKTNKNSVFVAEPSPWLITGSVEE